MKKIIIAIIAVVVLAILGVAIYLIVRPSNSSVIIDINPSVEFIVDKNDNVTQVNALNADAQLVIDGYDFEGITIEAATQLFIESSTKLGFIDVDSTEENPNEVQITVINSRETKQNTIQNMVQAKVENYFLENGVWGYCKNNSNLSENSELKSIATEYGITEQKARLIKSAICKFPDKTVAELKDLSLDELISLSKEQTIDGIIVANFKIKLSELKAIAEPTQDQLDEIAEIEANIDDVVALKAMIQTQKQARVQENQTKYEDMKANMAQRKSQLQSKWQSFKESVNSKSTVSNQNLGSNFLTYIKGLELFIY